LNSETIKLRDSLPGIAVIALLLIGVMSVIGPVHANGSVATTQGTYPPGFQTPSQAVLNSCPPLQSALTLVSSSQQFADVANGQNYTYSANGEQLGAQSCQRILFFDRSNGASIEAIVAQSSTSDTLSISNLTYLPPSNLTATNQDQENYAGFQAEYCSSHNFLGGCTGTSYIIGSENEAVVAESIGSPSPADNGDGCCAVAVWTGLSNTANVTGTDPLIQAGFASTNKDLGSSLYFWYEGVTSTSTGQVISSSCLKLNYGDSTYVWVGWGGGTSYTFLFDDNDASTTCEVSVSVTYSSLSSPTWAYYIGEDPASSSVCSYTSNDLCELPSWSTAYSVTGLLEGYGTSSWIGYHSNANPIGVTMNMDQGCGTNIVTSGTSNQDQFSLPYSNSDQLNYQC
jgi:hypothetical protein